MLPVRLLLLLLLLWLSVMQPVVPNPNLPGLTQGQVVVLAEKTYHFAHEGFLFCAPRCVTHFAEESIPYHPGEKACLDRCINKVKLGLEMAIDAKKTFEKQLKNDELPYQWMRDAASGKMVR